MRTRTHYSIRRGPIRLGFVRVRVVRVEGRRETELKRSRLRVGITTEVQATQTIALWGLPYVRADQRRRGVLKG